MLTRRNLFKFAATFGLSVFAPRFEQLASGAAVESRQGQDPSPERVLSQHEQSFLDLEWFENLKDDLDCVEVVAYVAPTFNMPASAEINLIRGSSHCLFCGEAGFRVGAESFTCKWCNAEGSAIELYAKAEGLPHEGAAARLEALLNDGLLKGRRGENEYAHRMLAEAARFYHASLCESPEGAVARECLAEQGIAPSTIEGFRLGYAPAEPDDLLGRHLVAVGYAIPRLLQTVRVNEEGEENLVDRYGGGHLLIPIGDQTGRSWGFMKHRLTSRQDSLQAGWTQDTLAVSERRLRRLIFLHPAWPQDFNRHQRVLITETPWEVVALHNAGIENAVYLFDCVTDPIRLRVLLSLGRDLICCVDPKGRRSVKALRVIEVLERETRHIRVMSVPYKGGLMELLQASGPQAVREAMSQAIPFL
jgi:DNA primase